LTGGKRQRDKGYARAQGGHKQGGKPFFACAFDHPRGKTCSAQGAGNGQLAKYRCARRRPQKGSLNWKETDNNNTTIILS
jgi:hypothetical protein